MGLGSYKVYISCRVLPHLDFFVVVVIAGISGLVKLRAVWVL